MKNIFDKLVDLLKVLVLWLKKTTASILFLLRKTRTIRAMYMPIIRKRLVKIQESELELSKLIKESRFLSSHIRSYSNLNKNLNDNITLLTELLIKR